MLSSIWTNGFAGFDGLPFLDEHFLDDARFLRGNFDRLAIDQIDMAILQRHRAGRGRGLLRDREINHAEKHCGKLHG